MKIDSHKEQAEPPVLKSTHNAHGPKRKSAQELQKEAESERIEDLIACLRDGIFAIEQHEERRRQQNIQPFLRSENDAQYRREAADLLEGETSDPNRMRALDGLRKILRKMIKDFEAPLPSEQVREDEDELRSLVSCVHSLLMNLEAIAEKDKQSRYPCPRLQQAMQSWSQDVERVFLYLQKRLELIEAYLSYR